MAAVLAVVAFGLALALVLAGTSTFHLHVSFHAVEDRNAVLLAESAVALGMERLVGDIDYPSGADGSGVVPAAPGFADSYGMFTFAPGVTRNGVAIPWSTQNAASLQPVEGYGRIVPASAVHLIGTGVCGDVVRHVEAILTFPAFPFSIASSGPVVSAGGLLVGSAANADDALKAMQGDSSKLLPGSLLSDSSAARAMVLGPNSRVSGDAQACGGIVTDASATILGAVRAHAASQRLPDLDVRSFDTAGQTGVQEVSGTVSSPTFSGFLHCRGDLTVAGDATLNGAVLYVDGSLSMSGALRGNGAVFVNGATRVGGNVDFETDNVVALLSQGDVSIAGSGRDSSFFRGLVYTHGNFIAHDVSLLGVFVANASGTGSQVDMGAIRADNVDLVALPEWARIPVRAARFTPGPSTSIPFCMHCSEYGMHLPNGGHEKSRPILRINVQPTSTGLMIQDPVTSAWSGPYTHDRAIASMRAMVEAATGLAMKPTDSHYKGWMVLMDQLVPPGLDANGGPPPVIFTFDLSKYVSLTDAPRLLLWREF